MARPAPATVAQPPSTTSAAGVDVTSTIALLDRIQKMLDDATDGKPGEVKIERGLVDEMRAELTQARLALKGSE